MIFARFDNVLRTLHIVPRIKLVKKKMVFAKREKRQFNMH